MSDIFDQLTLSCFVDGWQNECIQTEIGIVGEVHKNIVDMCPNLTDVLQEFPHTSMNMQRIVQDHLTRITQKFTDYFPNNRRPVNVWIHVHFSVDHPSDVDVVL